ncbi:DUF4279 domain-containing protein [Aliarcobacter cryaerophilus]|uniref:DUF4279 domain-containing protein n=1 Tax=Aliarcobacter cryaerophilus TaxID=28198 RepID=UPI0011E01082|nr:DUF4279 domain-containing protein [Aliarcobacter cryaerophilus]
MTEIYIDFTISSKKDTLICDLNKLTNLRPYKTRKIGDKLGSGRIIEENEWIYYTEKIKSQYLENATEIFCNILEVFKNELSEYIKQNNCEVSICFVLSLDIFNYSIFMNQRFINLSSLLCASIDFDIYEK